ncbi:MAG: 3-oxoacyl-[acyl-carrier protein] reductase, partial [uncultured Cytophagales bacterium]
WLSSPGRPTGKAGPWPWPWRRPACTLPPS